MEPWEDEFGTTTRAEDIPKETVFMLADPKVRAKAKTKETVTRVDHQGITQESTLIRSCGEKSHPAREHPKGKEGGNSKGK